MIKTNSKTLKRIGGFHGGLVVKSPPANAEDNGSTCGSERSPGEKMTPTPVFLPGEPHGQRNLAGCSPQGRRWVGHDLVTKQQQQQKELV